MKKLRKKAENNGIFIFRDGKRWDFFSKVSGHQILIWYSDSGKWLHKATVGNVQSPFAALKKAITFDRANPK